MRLIDADALKRKAQRLATESWMMRATATIETVLNQFIEWIDNAPTVQPERPRGHWVEIGDEPYDEWECDVCGFVIDGSGCIDPEAYRDVYRFCPHCGSDMRGEQE